MKFWISWIQRTEDYRPLHYPPNGKILGWWCSGYDPDDNAVLCALVEGRYESEAREAIFTEWPEALSTGDWRFFERVPKDFVLGDRFPLSDWMKERIFPLASASAPPTQQTQQKDAPDGRDLS